MHDCGACTQLNKAIRSAERLTRADKNLKDWIVFRRARAGGPGAVCSQASRDNTGVGQFVPNQIFPTTSFPSDHAIVCGVTNLNPKPYTLNPTCYTLNPKPGTLNCGVKINPRP